MAKSLMMYDCVYQDFGFKVTEYTKTVALIYCSQYFPDIGSKWECITKTYEEYKVCARSQWENFTLTVFKSGGDPSEEVCDQGIKIYKCLKPKAKACSPGAEQMVDFFAAAHLGGKCLAKNRVLNTLVTMEICEVMESGWSPGPKPLTSFFGLCLVVVASIFFQRQLLFRL